MRLGILLGILLLVGCVTAPTQMDKTGTRTYSIEVKSVTSTCFASSCHPKTVALGNYDADKAKASDIKNWLKNGKTAAGLTDAQVKDVEDWIQAGMPADPNLF